jgi:hypothetical protein
MPISFSQLREHSTPRSQGRRRRGEFPLPHIAEAQSLAP